MSQWLICEQGHLAESADAPEVSSAICLSCGQSLRVASPQEVATCATPRAINDSLDSTWDQSGQTSVSPIKPLAKTLGDYELLDEIGRGGMGVVYRARQRSVNRIVALKIIRPDRVHHDADALATAIARLRTEAHAAARLNHDNVVTVYDVGQVDGTPYYSMRLVDGPSLSAMLRDGPLEPARAARYLSSVASAVHEAHLQGILHRDLKPANILIDERSDRALVTDFGLAKILADGSDLTIAGQVFGSPPYMSPEQGRDASQATIASDIYSLGATLYCALTGKPPFQAATIAETLRQVSESPPVPPRRLRQAIDLDLETICLKCLEKDPKRRYDSAQSLADDLLRYLGHEPIAARRISRAARIVRWCRRKPAAAVAIGAIICLGISAAAFVVAGRTRDSRAKHQSQFLSGQADTGFREALAAYEKLAFEVQEELGDDPATRSTRRALLQTALDGMSKVMVEHRDATARLRAATLIRMGDIATELGQSEAALEHLREATTLLESDLARKSGDLQAQRDYSVACERYGMALHHSGRAADAREYFTRCFELRSKLPHDTREARRDMALVHHCLAKAAFALADWNEAKRQNEDAIRWIREAGAQKDREPQLQQDLALYYSALGDIELQRKEVPASEAAYKSSIEAAEAFGLDRDNFALRATLASSWRLLGDTQRAQERWEEAEVSYQRAFDITQELVKLDPEAANVQWLKAITTHRVGLAEYHSDGKSLARILESVKLLTPIVARSLHDPAKVGELAATHDFVAQALRGANDAERAFDHEMKAQEVRARAALQKPDNAQERMKVGVGYVRIAATADTNSRPSHALEAYRRALAFFQREDNQNLLRPNAEYQNLMNQLPLVVKEFENVSEP